MQSPSSRRRKRWILFALLAFTFLGVIGGALYVLRRGRGRSNLLTEAGTLKDKGDLKGAEAKFREVLKSNPRDNVARANLIDILMDRKAFDEATELARELTTSPDTAVAGYRMLSDIAYRRADFAQAQRLARSISDQDPEFAQRTILKISDAIGTPQSRSQALSAAMGLVTLTESDARRGTLLVFIAETLLDLRTRQSDEKSSKAMSDAARQYLDEAGRLLQGSPDWKAGSEPLRLVMARIELLSADPLLRDRGEKRLLAALEKTPQNADIRVALAAFYSRNGQPGAATAQLQAVARDPNQVLLWLRGVRAMLEAGQRAEVGELLAHAPSQGAILVDLLRARYLLEGTEAEKNQGKDLLVARASDASSPPELGFEAYRLLTEAGMHEDARAVLRRMDVAKPDVRIRAEIVRSLASSPDGAGAATILVDQLAKDVQSTSESLQVLGTLQRGAGAESVLRYLDGLVAKGGPDEARFRLMRAAMRLSQAKPETPEVEKESLRRSAVEDLQAIVALPGGTRENFGSVWPFAMAARDPRLAGRAFVKAALLDGPPYEMANAILGIAGEVSDPSARTAFSEGLLEGATETDRAFRDLLVHLMSSGAKDLLEAQKAAAKAIESTSTRIPSILLSIQIAKRLGDDKAEQALVERFLEENPKLAIARDYAAGAKLRSKRYEDVLALQPKEGSSIVGKMQRLQALSRLKRLTEAVQEGREFLREHPDDSAGYLALAALQLEVGDKKAALGVLSATPIVTREIALMRASLLAEQKQLDVAEKLYVTALSHSGFSDVDAWVGLAATMHTGKRNREFASMISPLIEGKSGEKIPQPLITVLFMLRGMALEATNSLEGALADYERSISLGSKEATPYNNAAWLILSIRKQDLPTAQRYIARALELAPDNASIHHTASKVHEAAGDKEAALRELTLAIQASERNRGDGAAAKPEYLCDRADLLAGMDRKTEAIEQAEEVLRKFPGTPIADRAAAILVRLR